MMGELSTSEPLRIKKIWHNGTYQIGLYFGFDESLKTKAKNIGAVWSKTHKCWYLLYNTLNYRKIQQTFSKFIIVDQENNQLTVEPALTKQETVHIAHGEFHPNKVDEHKESSPENTDNIVFKGTIGKYWILSVRIKKRELISC